MARSSLALSNVNASEMGVRDFYSIHVLSFCEGYDINSQRRAIRDVAYCSKRSATFEFDLSTALAADLHPGFNISDLTWPSTIADDFKFLSVTTKAVSTLYIIGAIATGMKVLMELFLLTTGGNRSSMLAHLVLTAVRMISVGSVRGSNKSHTDYNIVRLCDNWNIIDPYFCDCDGICRTDQQPRKQFRHNRDNRVFLFWDVLVYRHLVVHQHNCGSRHSPIIFLFLKREGTSLAI